MKINKNKLTTLALAVGLLAGANSSVFASESQPTQPSMDSKHEQPRMGPEHFRRDPLGPLNLTDTQKEKVKSIFDSHKIDHKDVFGDMQKTRKELNQLIASDDYTESKAQDIIKQGADELSGILSNKATIDHEIYKILTPEQQGKFLDMLNHDHPKGPRPDFRTPPRPMPSHDKTSEQPTDVQEAPPAQE